MNTQLLIPTKIKVGFQDRSDTYTKKLAYVIYYDTKGKLRKEVSWESWRDKKIEPKEFENVPTEGFVLNKGVGGARHSYWNARNEYIRVYDPRDFEFEISVANLLFILRECDCSKGKGLEGKFVYAWDGKDLILLPEISTDYKTSKKYTTLQSNKVKAKDLVKGVTYQSKKQEALLYLGRLDYYEINKDVDKRYVFWDDKNFVFLKNMQPLAGVLSDLQCPNFAEIVENYYKSKWGTKIIKLLLKETIWSLDYCKYFYYKVDENTYLEGYTYQPISMPSRKIILKDNKVVYERCNLVTGTIYNDHLLCAELESGSIYQVTSYGLQEIKNG